MLKHIHLENFKSWRELDIDLAPITLLFGTNSSGKSSVLQALLLLMQTEEKTDWRNVHFGSGENDYTNLGSYQNVVFRHNLNQVITVALEYYFNSLKNELLRHDSVCIKYEHDSVAFQLDEELQNWLEEQLIWPTVEQKPSFINYLGPLRQHPQRTYLWSGSMPTRIEPDGENTIAALVGAERLGHNLPKEVSTWLQRMELVDNFTTKALDKEKRFYETTVQIDGVESSILDVGFGISQVLPVITTLFFVPEGSIVLLEQPELHLHPRAQAHLADLFLHVAEERHLQLIVESHSEHLLRRFQRHIAEAKSPFATPENIRAYFCQKGDNGSTIEQVKVDTFGQISNWPDNFFGDITGDLEAMTIAALQRSRNGH